MSLLVSMVTGTYHRTDRCMGKAHGIGFALELFKYVGVNVALYR
jgi:hypothetical protein